MPELRAFPGDAIPAPLKYQIVSFVMMRFVSAKAGRVNADFERLPVYVGPCTW